MSRCIGDHTWAAAVDDGAIFYLCSICGHEADTSETTELLESGRSETTPWLEDAERIARKSSLSLIQGGDA